MAICIQFLRQESLRSQKLLWKEKSSIVYEVIRTISSQSIFHEKILNAQKRKSNQNQPTKQKQINTEQQRQQSHALTKTSKSVEIVRFAF